MRGRYRLFNNRVKYVRNILSPAPNSIRPSNFLYADILEFLIRNRKVKIDYSVEGYASGRTIVNRMGQLGYDEDDAFSALVQLSKWNLVEPESLLIVTFHWMTRCKSTPRGSFICAISSGVRNICSGSRLT